MLNVYRVHSTRVSMLSYYLGPSTPFPMQNGSPTSLSFYSLDVLYYCVALLYSLAAWEGGHKSYDSTEVWYFSYNTHFTVYRIINCSCHFARERAWRGPNHTTEQKLWYSIYNTHFMVYCKINYSSDSICVICILLLVKNLRLLVKFFFA
jgi:hypothetical protein